jgi:hypothetical protein
MKPSNRLRTTAKLALAVAGITIAGIITLLIIFFNLSNHEKSFAGSPMVFESADVIQDTASALRGSINEMIIGVEIKTAGDQSPLKLSSITFSANGTTQPAVKNIENARLWFTGNEKNFTTAQQVGQTITVITEQAFDISVNKVLNPGKSYFWLTFDIKADAITKNGKADAECTALHVGANVFVPNLSSPAGKKNILSSTPYFSTGLSYANQLAAWNSKRDGSGDMPQKLNDPRHSYFVQSGHKLMNSVAASLPYIVIEKHALLKAQEMIKTKNLVVDDGGVFEQDFVITSENPVENFRMLNGANYLHNNTGKIAGMQKNFSPHSNQCFFKYGEETFSEAVRWGNVLINSSQMINMNISNAFKSVQGDFEIRRTGINNFLFTGTSDTINIGGSLIFTGGAFFGSRGTNNSLTINVGRDMIMKSGEFRDGDGNKNSRTVLNITGNVLFLGGAFDFNKNHEGLSQINLVTDYTSGTISWLQKAENVALGNMHILPGKEVVIKTGKIGNIAINRALTVDGGARLMCGKFPVTGDGGFILKENATLGIGDEKGINSLSQTGNILTKEKYFDSGANYIFYTGTTPQATGFFDTSPDNGKVKTMVVKKDNNSDVVVLSQSLEVTDQMLISMGQLEKRKNKLILSKLSDVFRPAKVN